MLESLPICHTMIPRTYQQPTFLQNQAKRLNAMKALDVQEWSGSMFIEVYAMTIKKVSGTFVILTNEGNEISEQAMKHTIL